MDWWKEVAKMCLNIAVLALGVFVFGYLTNPQWNWKYVVFGMGTIALALTMSRLLWKRGERKDG
jgi:hypothetical protein